MSETEATPTSTSSTSTTTTTTVIISGAGPGGLTLALTLKRLNVPFVVIEKCPLEFLSSDAGGGYDMSLTSIRAMDELGVGKEFHEASYAMKKFRVVTGEGKPIRTIDIPQDETFSVRSIRRAKLQRLLIDALGDNSVTTNVSVTGYEQDNESITVSLSNGNKITGTLLVGADGIHSVVRKQMLVDNPIANEIKFQHCTCWWGKIIDPESMAQLSQDEMPVDEALWVQAGSHMFMGGRLNNEVLWAMFERTDEYIPLKDQQMAKQDAERAIGSIKTPIAKKILDLSPVSTIARVAIQDKDPLTTWIDGRAILIGDAAHPMTPFIGQGANMAVCDGWLLGKLLAIHNLEGHTKLFKKFESARLEATKDLQLSSRNIGSWSCTDSSFKKGLMSLVLWATPNFLLKGMFTTFDNQNAAALKELFPDPTTKS